MTSYAPPRHLTVKPYPVTDLEDLAADTWQHAGVVAQRLVKRLHIPTPTAILLREQAAGTAGPADYRTERTRLVKTQADLAQLQLEKERHEVVPITAIAEGVGECFSAARAKWLAVPSKYAPIVNPNDPPAAHKILSRAVREVLVEISEEAEAEIARLDVAK